MKASFAIPQGIYSGRVKECEVSVDASMRKVEVMIQVFGIYGKIHYSQTDYMAFIEPLGFTFRRLIDNDTMESLFEAISPEQIKKLIRDSVLKTLIGITEMLQVIEVFVASLRETNFNEMLRNQELPDGSRTYREFSYINCIEITRTIDVLNISVCGIPVNIKCQMNPFLIEKGKLWALCNLIDEMLRDKVNSFDLTQ